MYVVEYSGLSYLCDFRSVTRHARRIYNPSNVIRGEKLIPYFIFRDANRSLRSCGLQDQRTFGIQREKRTGLGLKRVPHKPDYARVEPSQVSGLQFGQMVLEDLDLPVTVGKAD